jgi:hypothetical protein
MNCSMISEFLDSPFSTLFKCKKINEYLSISTPFFYPDGDVLEVFLNERSGKIVLSDIGETLRFLSSYDLEVKNSTKRQRIIDNVTQLSNVKFFRGVFYKPISTIDEIPGAIFDLSQCIIRTCDLLYTIKGSSRAAFVEEVKDFLDFKKFKFEENFTVETDSANTYQIDLAVETGNHLRLVELMNPPAQYTHRPKTDHIVKMWADIESFSDYDKSDRITLLDDSNYSWRKSDTMLIEKFSIITTWSNKDELIKRISTVA